MPELKCTVQTCMHNQDFLCRLDSIQVGGSQAKASKETCCDSFEERKTQGMENSYTNAYGNHCEVMHSSPFLMIFYLLS